MERQEDRDKAKATIVLNAVFRTIAMLIAQEKNIELDLGVLGRISVHGGTVTH